MANSVAARRVARELGILNAAPIVGIEITPKEDNILEWDGTVAGPVSKRSFTIMHSI